MTQYKTVYLADHPEYIDTCAAWHFTAWGVKSEHRTLQKDIARYKISLGKDTIPLTLVTIDTKKNVPVATCSIWENDSSYWSELSPWLTSLFVHEDYRGQGLAKSLISQIEKSAKTVGIPILYLTASAAADMYGELGYVLKEVREAPETPTGKQSLFYKDLT